MKTTFKPGTKIRLKDIDPASCSGLTKRQAKKRSEENRLLISNLAYRLWAENKRSILIVLQGMDTAGKDGVIRHIINAVNPQACPVYSFKVPTSEEQAHDFLWRIHAKTPRHGNVAVFNRSYYEDVGVVRVHGLVPKEVWQARFEQINAFESLLASGGTTVLKFFLHISKTEQLERLKARLEDPNKQWKFSAADAEERKYWDEYMKAYDDALTLCNTTAAPWFVVPADRKWHRDYCVGTILRKTLEHMNPQFPKASVDVEKVKLV